ncbi:kinase 2B, chloroplastic [Olea europaea subsp. europaea]|uniref:Kinase 2B, chloroplastic n=1 Tax=Olea europaea subsp. europaea TaxID=158383 RepID=A0A8S0UXW7_OLEEU|nr:kinase 2B, chloroplastic [Olea europaea subsp. europaea]
MGRIYDNWERLVGATLKREEFRELARASSFSSTSSDFSSRFSFSSPVHNHTPVNPEASSSPSILFYSGESNGESLHMPRSEYGILQLPNANAKPIPFKELKKPTRNFRPDNIFRKGGFGPVFKEGINKRTLTAEKVGFGMTVAIKQWNRNDFQGCKGWLTEVNHLSHFCHPNLIKLIAYCTEGNNLLLVYEFMPKGSLYNHLFGRENQCLSWSTRIQVAVNTAEGLYFLHDAKNQVKQRNFKSANILLDKDFNAKLSDFGLARDGPPDDRTHVTTIIMGTQGYAAPEYITTGHLTEKCDVYGFGIVLLELLSGRRVIDRSTSKEQFLVDWARPYLSEEKEVYRVVDTKLKGQYPLAGAVIVSNLVLQCISSNPKSRPRMSEVLATLEQL